jgi:hypothetical protein
VLISVGLRGRSQGCVFRYMEAENRVDIPPLCRSTSVLFLQFSITEQREIEHIYVGRKFMRRTV